VTDATDPELKLADRNVTVLPLTEAAALLRLPPTAVEALVGSGYLVPTAKGPTGPEFTLPDLKAFLARNADNGSGNLWRREPTLEDLERVDPQDLLDALDGRADEMAKRVFDIFSTVFPEAATWGITKQARFIEQARSRFEAILAVTGQGAEVDEALVGDLQEVGASAASAGSPLPQLLVILRISRDLVVQTAVELAEERGGQWSLALGLLLTRVLPAMDRLTDALAQGYWAAILGREEESRARYQHVVEHAADGVYDVDLDGRIRYANPALALILGHRLEALDGVALADVIRPLDPSVSIESLLVDREGESSRLSMEVSRPDGSHRVLGVQAVARRAEGKVVGFQGIVRDETAERDLEAQRNEFLALVLALDPRPVDLAAVVEAALASVSAAVGVEVLVPDGLIVLADPGRLQHVIAKLVDHASHHGAPPVVVEVTGVVGAPDQHRVVLAVRSEALLSTPGTGLTLVRGLIEAMGGGLSYESVPGGGACFRVVLPTPSRRP
jgi:PAS domain S-box-containing protein